MKRDNGEEVGWRRHTGREDGGMMKKERLNYNKKYECKICDDITRDSQLDDEM